MSSLVRSSELFNRAKKVIPGGVNSPVRSFSQVGGVPRFIKSGKGVNVQDVDGNSYIDFVGSWGPLILGHSSKITIDALLETIPSGTSFGAPTEGEVEFSELICDLIPGLEMVRLVSSGTEATMSALRVARAFTGRDYVIKCNGCYHGHSDTFLVQAGSGVATQGISSTPGIPEEVVEKTLSVEFNDLDLMRKTIEDLGPEKIALIVVEPVPGNMGLILPGEGYLGGLRQLCDEFGILLLFDEVMSGFRVDLRGASGLYGVKPDLFCFGKVVGGGLPMAAFGGRNDIMEMLSPLGPVYQAGTLSGNPLAVKAGIATLNYLISNNPYPKFSQISRKLTDGMKQAALDNDIPFQSNSLGSMFGFYFNDAPVTNFTEAKKSDSEIFKSFFHSMLNKGVYFAPSPFEAGFIGLMHTDECIDHVLELVDETFREIRAN